MEQYSIEWRGAEIGTFSDIVPDMWYWEGYWVSNGTALAKEFEKVVAGFDAKAVFNDPMKGTKIVLHLNENHDQEIVALVISLGDSRLLIRTIYGEETIEWINKNVK